MADDGLEKLEAVFGAINKIAAGDDHVDLEDARCPKCDGTSFIQASDLYSEAVGRIEAHPDQARAVHVGGRSDIQIVEMLAPPRRKSAAPRVVVAALPLGGAAFFIYRRFGDSLGDLAIMVASVLTVIVLLTTMRRLSDQYYQARQRWNKLYMCRKCGQLIAS